MKASATAPSNIAFTKYWGKDPDPAKEKLRLPVNDSISACLDSLLTRTTVQFDSGLEADSFVLNGEMEEGEESRVAKHLDRIRKLAGMSMRARVESNNNFPKGTGLSSSASGFAALTVAGAKAAGLNLSERELSILARQGSGSACRSIPGGIVHWHAGTSNETSFAETVHAPDHWKIADVVAIVSEGRKEVSTTEGMKSAAHNPYIPVRVAGMHKKNDLVLKILADRDFTKFGELIERDALELHAMMLASGLIYLQPGTLEIMRQIQFKWRPEGLEAYFTINTGQDIHIICEESSVEDVQAKLRELPIVRNIIVNRIGEGTRLTNEHLF